MSSHDSTGGLIVVAAMTFPIAVALVVVWMHDVLQRRRDKP